MHQNQSNAVAWTSSCRLQLVNLNQDQYYPSNFNINQVTIVPKYKNILLTSYTKLLLHIWTANKIDAINSSDKCRYFRLLSKKLDSKEIN